MTKYYTQYWNNETWYRESEQQQEERICEHIASNLFRKKAIKVDDVVYVVTIIAGKLFVSSKMVVEIVCNKMEAATALNMDANELWDAADHIVAKAATIMNFDLEVPFYITKDLLFKTPDGTTKKLLFDSNEVLNTQTLRGVRELTRESAQQIDSLLPELKSRLSQSPQPIMQSDFLLPEEIADSQKYYEGALKRVIVNAYERNPLARKACIEHYGTICTVCNQDLELVYGDAGKGVIHVHHLKPISLINNKYEINPIQDLRPVCPSCHSVLHKRDPLWGIDELKELLTRMKQDVDVRAQLENRTLSNSTNPR